MKKKTILALLVLIGFLMGAGGPVFAADCKGTVISIEGNIMTVRDFKGKETTVEVDTRNIKIGDVVEVRNGKVTKEGGRKKKAVEGCENQLPIYYQTA